MIIGKTRRNCENNLSNNISKGMYYKISRLARQLIIDNNINSLPVNLGQLILNNHWRVISYAKAFDIVNLEEHKIMQECSGYVQKLNGNYYIFYDNTLDIPTQRFTIAHEIGHIVMQHFANMSPSREKEANMFASRLLMPMCVLYECNINSYTELKQMCNVNENLAEYRYNRLIMLKERNKFYTDKLELVVKSQFDAFIEDYRSTHQS